MLKNIFMTCFDQFKDECEIIFLKNQRELFRNTDCGNKKNVLTATDMFTYNSLVEKTEHELYLKIYKYNQQEHFALKILARHYISKFVLLANLFE